MNLSTHVSGNTLDLVYNEIGSPYVVLSAQPDIYILDHKSVLTWIAIPHRKIDRKKLQVRKLKKVESEQLCEEFKPRNITTLNNINDLVTS